MSDGGISNEALSEYLSNPNKLNEILQQVANNQARYKKPAAQPRVQHTQHEEPAIAPAKPLFGHWQDWISLVMIIVVLADHIRKQFRIFRYAYWFGGKKAKVHAANEGVLEDEKTETRPGLRKRKNKKSKKENKRRNNGDAKVLKDLEKPKTTAPRGINAYDLTKILAVVTCITDHYGYFGVPGLSYTAARWTRVIGRMSAPLFFYLAGYSNKFRFRWHSWCWAVLLFVVNCWLQFHLTVTGWDSMNTVLAINWLFQYIKWEKHLGSTFKWQLIIHTPIIILSLYWQKWVNDELRMAYGTLPLMFAIGAQLVRKGQFMGKVWLLAASVHYAIGSYTVFGRTPAMTAGVCIGIGFNCLIFMFFDKLSAYGEFKFFNKLGLVKDFMLYVSRQAIIVYITHLFVFRMIQLTKWNW